MDRNAILKALRKHPLVRFRHIPKRVFIVGSFANGNHGDHSDIDVLIEIKRGKMPEPELEESYRNRIRNYFVKHNIRGKRDDLHPQYNGRRIDLYVTYDADTRLKGGKMNQI